MIVVVGEALVDLVIPPAGAVEAVIGGAPYNTARAAARLGAPVRFVGGLSHDRFGARLTDALVDDGVDVGFAVRSELPTTLAAAEIDDRGSATYRFYFAGTAAPVVTPGAITAALVGDGAAPADIVLTGALALVLDPMRRSVVDAVDELDPATALVLDVNCRPAVVDDRDDYLRGVAAVVRRADVVKVSDEDLAFLDPGAEPLDAARRLIDGGAGAVVVTAGASGTTVVGADAAVVVDVAPVDGIVDTIGAGDTFGAGLVAWWVASGLGRGDVTLDALGGAVAAGHAAAAVVVSRRGADPPRIDDLAIEWPRTTGPSALGTTDADGPDGGA
ncbi:PfkB family carbohydrate kinase [Ilumatobacter sp.]|uniref:PfkB family carbohydrate kinase n=1 Tax=Ilumatobacter sp. TaxID=1967498 RepID=UPI003B518540